MARSRTSDVTYITGGSFFSSRWKDHTISTYTRSHETLYGTAPTETNILPALVPTAEKNYLLGTYADLVALKKRWNARPQNTRILPVYWNTSRPYATKRLH